ncbi:[FeFe] hydrogenase H-cluster maturation GTPase HydF [Clostridium tarantellae]|uniref:[FeFe] hydrogenase H-cluster maturation GTPase HydF n=1 Tax=Clostridium tarantellae TaxID=39493 RepID=A0A6I1MJY7_9CLOT|nr:[FeFe] hydrogenase H-cluster maturation GTPase HydF [Clostridium tarantellae]MPQ43264.1 [FeFe] hydrogenase H-cluster maturation GTPase HydF [Clostridium tarantellae]
MNETPRGNRLHIALFGNTNVGKSSIINALTGQNISLVSSLKGTTTDPVYKAMELLPIGPVVFIDTAGIDDEGEIGKLRIDKTKEVIAKTDVALLIFSYEDFIIDKKLSTTSCELLYGKDLLKSLVNGNKPVVGVLNKCDLKSVDNLFIKSPQEIAKLLSKKLNIPFVTVSTTTNNGIYQLKEELIKISPKNLNNCELIGDKLFTGAKILLITPQDIQAPKGRLILPQVQTLRDILDNGGIPIMCTLDNLDTSLELLNGKPDLVITDSQIFNIVNLKLPKDIPLTSFSILMAKNKGDLIEFYKGAKEIKNLKRGDKILIAEACTHHKLKGDIAGEKLPSWLSKICPGIIIENYSGKDFPTNLSEFKLVIHCGACMFNRAEVMSRLNFCKDSNVYITNFGLAIAEINGILDRVMKPLL